MLGYNHVGLSLLPKAALPDDQTKSCQTRGIFDLETSIKGQQHLLIHNLSQDTCLLGQRLHQRVGQVRAGLVLIFGERPPWLDCPRHLLTLLSGGDTTLKVFTARPFTVDELVQINFSGFSGRASLKAGPFG